LRPNHLGDIFQKKMCPTPKNIAQLAKIRPIWSHWKRGLFHRVEDKIQQNVIKQTPSEISF
jgi:hypothetical protein